MRQVNKLSEQMNILKALKVSHVIHCNYNMTGEGGGAGREVSFCAWSLRLIRIYSQFIQCSWQSGKWMWTQIKCKHTRRIANRKLAGNITKKTKKKKVPQLTKNANYNWANESRVQTLFMGKYYAKLNWNNKSSSLLLICSLFCLFGNNSMLH